MEEHSELAPPQISGADHGHAAVRALASAIPVGGGAALEIFNALVTPPIERRRQEWMAAVGSAIEQLRKADANIVETLQNNENFQSVLFHASWAAVQNHQAEKLTALRNAVLNAARGSNVPEDLQLLFVRYVDELTPTHLAVMKFFVEHEKQIAHLDSYQNLLVAYSQATHQDLDGIFFKLVCDDLKARSLLRISPAMADFPGVYEETTLATEQVSTHPRVIVTDMGRAFIEFVLTH